MEKYIQQYLSEFYYIKTSDAGNDGIYYVFDIKKNPTPIDGFSLIDEISKIFSLTNEESKKIIQNWAFNVKPESNLDFFWMANEQLIQASKLKK